MRTLIIFLCCLFSLTANAQYRLTGTVVDEQAEGLPGVNVMVLDAVDSSLVKGAVSDINGQFELPGLAGQSYVVALRYIGFETKYQTVTLQQDTDLGVITLQTASTALEEVVVTAKKPFYEQKIDRLVVNVEDSPSNAGATALEVLERSPGVQVDRVNNELALNGKKEVMVMIDGKMSRQSADALMQMLNSMNAGNVAKIELITNPPAKYEAAGTGGIINIQTISSVELGTTGSINVNAGYGDGEKSGVSGSFSNQKEKVSLFGDFSFNRDHTSQLVTNERVIRKAGETIDAFTINDRDPVKTNFNSKLGLNFTPDRKTTVGFLVAGFYDMWDMDAVTNTVVNSTMEPATQVTLETDEKGRGSHVMGNFHLARESEKSGWDVDFDYLYYGGTNTTDYRNSFFDNNDALSDIEVLQSNKVTPVHIAVASFNFHQDLGSKAKLEAGIKGIRSTLDNDVQLDRLENGVFEPDSVFTEQSDLVEHIGAAYTELTYQPDAKTRLNFGLRYEYSQTTLDVGTEKAVVDLLYNELFPSVFLSRQLAEETSVQLSYGRRITRPSFNDLAPFFIFIDPFTFFNGNTALRPSLSNNLKASINYKGYTGFVEYTNEQDAMAKFQPVLVEETDQQLFTSINLAYRNTLGIGISAPVKITSNWEANFNVIGLSRSIMSEQNGSNTQQFVNINMNQSFKLNDQYSMELSGFYNSESLDGVTKTAALYNLNFGLQKKLKNDANISFSVNNILTFKNRVFIPGRTDVNFFTDTTYEFESRIFKVSYKYRFGNKNIKRGKDNSKASEEIKSRMN